MAKGVDRASVRDWLRQGPGKWGRADLAVAAVAAVLVAVRWGDRARYLLTWDSHTFSLALERYDVNGLRPHAPGYPIYVALGRLVHTAVRDANDAYILLSILCCIAGAILTYAVARRLADRAQALAAMAIVLATPLLHVHAMTANAYAADLAFNSAVALAALWCRESPDPSPRRLVVLAPLYGVAVGVRQSLGFFLLPLVAWAALRPPFDVRTQARRLLPAAATGIAVGLAWFLPMAHASGGVATWRRANSLQSDVVFEHPVWRDGWMLEVNAERMLLYLRQELLWLLPVLGAVLAVAAVARIVRGGPRLGSPKPDERAVRGWAFLGLWALPPLAFYLTVYSGFGDGPSGYALILVPPLAIACVRIAAGAIATLPRRRMVRAGVAVLALSTSVLGLAAHRHDVADGDYKGHDGWVEDWSHLPESFPPANTSIVTAYNFAHVWYYYPDYQVFEYRPAGKAVGEVPDFTMVQEARHHEATPDWYDEIAQHKTPGPHPFAPGVENLVLFDFQLAGENGGERQLKDDVAYHEAWLPNGWRVLYVRLTPDRPLLEDYFTLEGAA